MTPDEIKIHISNFLNNKIDSVRIEQIKNFCGEDVANFLNGEIDAVGMERLKKKYGENLEKLNIHNPEPSSVDDYLTRFRLFTASAEYIELIIEPSDKILSPVKMNLIDNIEFEDIRVFMDGEPTVARIFTLESKEGVRFFTAEGGYNSFERPAEHTKEDFIKLLDTHPHLKNYNFAKYLKTTILHNELQVDLINNDETVYRKPKL
jgi:hypothetical protein